ncbi:hypothetical protein ASG49_00945 [Marmoricola sp. Leaf446]|uniref:endonuclease/exonuclease/phosphatase family protein n=1 Tax=Marmoricola sp. Leaf446 TaxID=1736379 RepID=UPI0006F84FFF|nr:endonuclease/exonuclease/phosphatase family protein [Marmoricola sp. Leaf446]KQT93603.1 hypothetical protein ASG49_00945 [Marmoricola sp. Leaf446]
MRPWRHAASLLVLSAALLVAGHPGVAPAGSAPGGGAVALEAEPVSAVSTARSTRPQGFAASSIRAVRRPDGLTISWPSRLRATGYTVAWAPTTRTLPTSPATCAYPCKLRFTRGTTVNLSAADLTSFGRRVSSASGNTVRLKVFSHNGRALSSSGLASWVAPSATTSVDWLPSRNAQLPLPLPPAAGRPVALTSFNVLSANTPGQLPWQTRGPRVSAQIDATGSSIVATQEASNSPTGVGSGSSQYADLAARLQPRGWALADDRNWDRASDPRQASSASSQATRTYYRDDVWRRVDRGAMLTHTPIAGQTGGVNVDRWVSWVRLAQLADPATQVCVVNVHLLTNLGTYDRASADHRDREVAQVLGELRDPGSDLRRVGTRVGAACDGVPTVVAGDLNAAQGHAPYGNQPQATLTGAGFADTANAGRRHNTRWSGPGTVEAWHLTGGTQIDYILSRGTGGAVSFKVNAAAPTLTGSDHYPITAVVNVPPCC